MGPLGWLCFGWLLLLVWAAIAVAYLLAAAVTVIVCEPRVAVSSLAPER